MKPNFSHSKKHCPKYTIRLFFIALFTHSLFALAEIDDSVTQTPPNEFFFDIPAQPLSSAIQQLALISSINIIVKHRDIASKQSNALNGQMSALNALSRLIANKELKVTQLNKDTFGVFVVKQQSQSSILPKKTTDSTTKKRLDDNYMEVIYVTARKIEENWFNVPVKIEAFSNDNIVQQRLHDAQSLLSQISSVTYAETFTVGSGPKITIRGASDDDHRPNGSTSTSIHVNGVYQGSNALFLQDYFDLERIEVLKGPQGTLYGRNATAGAVNLITRKPEQVLSAYIDIESSSFNKYRVEGGIGGPISRFFRSRLSFLHSASDGPYTHLGSGAAAGYSAVPGVLPDTSSVPSQGHWGGENSTSMRFSTDFDLAESTFLESVLKYSKEASKLHSPDFNKNTIERYQQQSIRFIDFDEPTLAGYVEDLDDDPFTFFADNLPTLDAHNRGLSSSLTHYFDDSLILAVIGGLEQFDRTYETAEGLPISALDTQYHDDFSQQTLEARVSKSNGKGVDWLAGVFVLKDSLDFSTRLNFLQSALWRTQIETDYTQQRASQAIFGHIDWPIFDNVDIELGLRYSADKTTFKGITSNTDPYGLSGSPLSSSPVYVPPPIGPNQTLHFDETADDRALTWKVNLQYMPEDNINLYASASTGFKSGGFDGSTILTPGEALPISPEQLKAIEIGAKYISSSNRFGVETSLYKYDFNDYQSTAFVNFNGDETNVRTNVAEASIRGIEISGHVDILDALKLSSSISILNSNITAFRSANAVERNFVGNQLPFAPKLSWNVSMVYKVNIGGFDISANWTASATDSVFVSVSNSAAIDSYTLNHANVSVTKNRWTLSLFARNLFNEQYLVGIQPLSPSLPQQEFQGRPRSVGLGFRYTLN